MNNLTKSVSVRRGACVFAAMFAMVSVMPFSLTAYAQKGRAPIAQSRDDIERRMKMDYQRSNPKRTTAPATPEATAPVSTNAAGNTTYNITFDAGDAIGGLAVGAVLGTQYQATTGAVFTPNAFSGTTPPPPTPDGWATNTDTTIVSSTGSDVGGLGAPALVSGNVLRSFNGWLGENGNASMRVTFDIPVSTFTATFCGIFTPASSRIFAFDASNNLLTTSAAAGTGQQVVNVASSTPIKSVVITAGDFGDWVGVDNITFTTVSAGGPQNVDSQVSFTTTTQGLTGIAGPCATQGYTNQYNINVDLRNIGTNTLTNPFFQVTELRQTDGTPTANPFRLRTSDDFVAASCTGGLVGSTQAIPGPITPAQVIPVNFQIGMPQLRRFRFFVSVFATVSGGLSKNARTVKLGQIAVEATGFDKAGNPILSAVFVPEKGAPTAFQTGTVKATLVK